MSDEKKQQITDTPVTGESSSSGPSAPPPEHQQTQEQHLTQSPTRPAQPAGFVYPSTDIQNSSSSMSPPVPSNVPAGPPPPHASAGPAPTMSAYDMPPPSYQAAMSYPAAPTYGGSDPKYYNNAGSQPPIYYQAPQTAPQPNQIEVNQIVRAVRIQNPAIGSNVIVHVQPGAPCRRCTVGVITRQTDMCCLLCLIMLTIFTFPFGLVFLCCVPCTVQNRCTNCNRIA